MDIKNKIHLELWQEERKQHLHWRGCLLPSENPLWSIIDWPKVSSINLIHKTILKKIQIMEKQFIKKLSFQRTYVPRDWPTWEIGATTWGGREKSWVTERSGGATTCWSRSCPWTSPPPRPAAPSPALPIPPNYDCYSRSHLLRCSVYSFESLKLTSISRKSSSSLIPLAKSNKKDQSKLEYHRVPTFNKFKLGTKKRKGRPTEKRETQRNNLLMVARK